MASMFRRAFIAFAVAGLIGCNSPRDEEPVALPEPPAADAATTTTPPPPVAVPSPDAGPTIDSAPVAPGGGCRPEQRTCSGGTCVASGGCCPEDSCPIPHGRGACVAGTCRQVSCDQGFDDCELAQPGCETDLSTTQGHCGSCANACGTGQTCKAGMCACPVASCASGCVDTATDPLNCGACDRVCAGACSRGACVCPTPNAQNRVRNGGFDRDVAGWIFESPLQPGYASDDASNCGGSGSATFTDPRPRNNFQPNITQCQTQVMPGVRYRFGAWFRLRGTLPTQGDLQVALQWHTEPGCAFLPGVVPPAEFAHGSFVEALDSWLLITGESVAAPGTRSAQLRLIINGGDSASPLQGSVDMAFVTPAPGRW